MDRALVESVYTPAALAALEQFPVEMESIRLVKQSENITWRVSAKDGGYVFRLHRPGYNSLEELESERTWTDALDDAGVPVPRSVRTRGGKHFTSVDIPSAKETRYAGMTRWQEGVVLCDYLETPAGKSDRLNLLERIGELIAATHSQAAHWDPPPGFTRPRLDRDGLVGDAPRWGRFWDLPNLPAADNTLLLETRDTLSSTLDEYGMRADNFSLIHADLNPDNIVLNDGQLALIDFDDSGFGWHMYDVACTLIDFRLETGFEAARDALMEGYTGSRTLKQKDIDMLDAFLLIRGMAILGWYKERPEHTGSTFFRLVADWVIGECRSIDR